MYHSFLILKEKFINQLAPDSQRKLLKLAFLGPPHHSMQNKELGPEGKKMDNKVDHTQLLTGPSWSPEFLAPAV